MKAGWISCAILFGCGDGLPDARDGGDAGIDATIMMDGSMIGDTSSMDVADEMSMTDSGLDAGVDTGPPVTMPWGVKSGNNTNQYAQLYAVAVGGPSSDIVVGGSIANTVHIRRLDAMGGTLWTAAQTGQGHAYTVGMDASGNMYVGGLAQSSFDLGGGTITNGYLLKLDPKGKVLWQHSNLQATFRCIAFKSNGNVIIGGSVDNSADFGGGTMTANGPDALLIEYTPTNTFVRAKQFGPVNSYGIQQMRHCAVDASDNVVVAGYFDDQISLGGSTFTGPAQGSGALGTFVAKLSPTLGHIASIDLKMGDGLSGVAPIALDSSGNVFVAGWFGTSVDLGGGALMTAGNRDAFIGKLDSSLNHKWSKRFGDSDNQFITAIATDPSGRVGFTGAYSGNLNFGCGALPGQNQTTAIFTGLFDTSGACVINHTYSATTPSVNAMAFLTQPDFVIAGGFFGSITLPSGQLSAGNNWDGFVARLQP